MLSVDFGAGARATREKIESGRQDFQEPIQEIRGRAAEVDVFMEVAGQLAGKLPVRVYPDAQALDQPGVVPAVEKIAIVGSRRISDYIFSLPALNALRLTYPQAEIVLLGQGWHRDFLSGRPSPVDRVEVVPEFMDRFEDAPSDETQEKASFIDRMAAENFDLALQMSGTDRYSNAWLPHMRARKTAGFRRSDSPILDRWVPYAYYHLDVLRYLEVVSLVGVEAVSLESRVYVTESDCAEAAQWIPDGGAPLVVLHPGGRDVRRQWPAEKFAAVAQTLAWTGARVVVVGNAEEKACAEAVSEAVTGDIYNVCGQLSLSGLAGLLAKADAVLANDTGLLHLAYSVGTPTVGLFWCADMMTSGPVTRAHHRPLVSWRTTCPECGIDATRYACEHAVSFIRDISTEEVTTAVLDLLQVKHHAPPEHLHLYHAV